MDSIELIAIYIVPWLLLAMFGALYFIPTVVAARRKVNLGPVIVINVFLGWSLIGWVVALALAVAGKPAPYSAPALPMAPNPWADLQSIGAGVQAVEGPAHHTDLSGSSPMHHG